MGILQNRVSGLTPEVASLHRLRQPVNLNSADEIMRHNKDGTRIIRDSGNNG